MGEMLRILTNLFGLWTVLGVMWAWFFPAHFTWFIPSIPWGLAGVMLGMGLTLTFDDFRNVLKTPKAIGVGVAAQFLIMPTVGYAVAKLSGLPAGLAAGIVLVSCCPGGVASNVITYLARANVALSVLMTMCSTIGAILLTPILTGWLAGAFVDVNEWALLKDTVKVILLPVVVGLLLNQFFPKVVKPAMRFTPLLSVLVIVLIVGAIVGVKKQDIAANAGALLISVFALHFCGFAIGYLFAKVFGYGEEIRRTVAIEVGMQNSGLGTVLAKSLPDPAMASLAAAPCALSAVAHCIIGSLMAGFWRLRKPEVKKLEQG
jgi:bile acid:Na+ symporter, BASS family